MVEDVVVGFGDSVRQPVVAYELPDVLDRVELGAFRRQRQQGDIGWNGQPCREMPAGLVKYQHGMGAWRHGSGYLGEMQRHVFGVAAGQNERRALALGRIDGLILLRPLADLYPAVNNVEILFELWGGVIHRAQYDHIKTIFYLINTVIYDIFW